MTTKLWKRQQSRKQTVTRGRHFGRSSVNTEAQNNAERAKALGPLPRFLPIIGKPPFAHISHSGKRMALTPKQHRQRLGFVLHCQP
jgi:hypothetical protein